jgi:hypothetical protein
MSQDKLFVIGIGGTGMRCLEAFVHLCAMGMCDNKEINILTLDTDQENGNLKRVWDLINLYNRIKNPSGIDSDSGGKPASNTFFSAKLNLSKYWPSYSRGVNYKELSNVSILSDETKENIDLASLFLSDAAQNFDLAHGYRAQTHLGSQLMYHSIIDAAKNVKTKGNGAKPEERNLIQFIRDLFKVKSQARVFIFGSIFGGTGASSIPVIPTAFNDAYNILGDNHLETKSTEAKFGASLLTEYFKFKSPTDAQKKEKGNAVIADSSYFTLNSQAALQFYQNDPTVKSTYKCLYNIGWPVGDVADFSKGKNESETITGGAAQKNPCHVTELLCAFSALDFFNRLHFEENQADYLFRTVRYDNNSFHFDFKDFSGDSKQFKNALPGLYSIALLTLVYHNGLETKEGMSGWIDRMKRMKYVEYENAIDDQCKNDLTDYFKSFLFNKKDGKIIPGWLYQIKNSFNGHFLLTPTSFSTDLAKINAGDLLEDEKSKWALEKSLLGITKKLDAGGCSNKFIDNFIKSEVRPEQYPTGEAKERLIAQLFNTITSLQKV